MKPVDPALADEARRARLVVTVEDNGVAGGFGDAVCRLLRDAGVPTPARTFGIPQRFLAHGSRDEVLDEIGLVPQHLARQITEAVAQLDPELAEARGGVGARGEERWGVRDDTRGRRGGLRPGGHLHG